jgi:hypothetical protein
MLLPGQKSSVCFYIVICIEKIGIDTECSVKGEVVAILKVVVDKIFVIRIDYSVDKVIIEGELSVILKKILYVCSSVTGCIRKEDIISTLTNCNLCKFEKI